MSIIEIYSNGKSEEDILSEDIVLSFEEKLNSIRGNVSSDSIEINMSELDEISDKIIEAKTKLESFALKNETGIKKKLSTIPFFKGMIKSSQEIIDQNKTVSEILDNMISYFDQKYDIIVSKVNDLEKLSLKIENDISLLEEWIVEASSAREELSLNSDKLKIDKMISVAKMEVILKKDTLINKISPSISASMVLAENINTLSPILRGSLQDELRITSSLNTFKDASIMLVELKSLVVNLKTINNAKVEDIVIMTLDSANKSLFTPEELNDLVKASEKSQKNMLEYAKKIKSLTLENIDKVNSLESEMSDKFNNQKQISS